MTSTLVPRKVAGLALGVSVVLLVGSIVWAASGDDDGAFARFGPGMMGYVDAGGDRSPVRSISGAGERAGQFADRLDLRVTEVMQFDNNYYVELRERDGRNATEVLVDPRTGAVAIEPGPAMMWNTRYGMMSGRFGMGTMRSRAGGMIQPRAVGAMMRGSSAGDPTWPGAATGRAVSAAEARRLANAGLDEARSGLRASEAKSFPGYFTLHTMRDGRVAGMLSVNASTGAVWPHWWHGRFVAMSE